MSLSRSPIIHDRANRLKAEVGSLQAQLATSEEDRTARLDVIERLDAGTQALRSQLEISEQDRAARLEEIECLDAEVQALRSRLEISEQDRAARTGGDQTPRRRPPAPSGGA
jgi:hypothetical protein